MFSSPLSSPRKSSKRHCILCITRAIKKLQEAQHNQFRLDLAFRIPIRHNRLLSTFGLISSRARPDKANEKKRTIKKRLAKKNQPRIPTYTKKQQSTPDSGSSNRKIRGAFLVGSTFLGSFFFSFLIISIFSQNCAGCSFSPFSQLHIKSSQWYVQLRKHMSRCAIPYGQRMGEWLSANGCQQNGCLRTRDKSQKHPVACQTQPFKIWPSWTLKQSL